MTLAYQITVIAGYDFACEHFQVKYHKNTKFNFFYTKASFNMLLILAALTFAVHDYLP